jgi:hypothetical protein
MQERQTTKTIRNNKQKQPSLWMAVFVSIYNSANSGWKSFAVFVILQLNVGVPIDRDRSQKNLPA